MRNFHVTADDQVTLEQFSALVASSQLQSLRLWCCVGPAGDQGPCGPVPRGALQHMFPAGRQLQHLTELVISNNTGSAIPPPAAVHVVNADDLVSVATCCPHLQRLELDSTLQPSTEAIPCLVQLQQQVQLRALVLGGTVVSNDAAPFLAQMSSLTYIKLAAAPAFTDVGLQQLTALQQLVHLEVHGAWISDGLCSVAADMGFGLKSVFWAGNEKGSLRVKVSACHHSWSASSNTRNMPHVSLTCLRMPMPQLTTAVSLRGRDTYPVTIDADLDCLSRAYML